MAWLETKKIEESQNKIPDKVDNLSSKHPKITEKYNNKLDELNRNTIDKIRKWKDKAIKQIEDYLNSPLNPLPNEYEISWDADGTNGNLSITKSGKKWQVWISFDKMDNEVSLSFSWTRNWWDVNTNGRVSITDTFSLNSNNTALNIQNSSIENAISWRYDKNFKLDNWNIHTNLFWNIDMEKSKWEKLQVRTRIWWKVDVDYKLTDNLSWNGIISGSIDKNNDYLKWRTHLSTWIDYSFSNKYSLWTNIYYEKWKGYQDSYYKMYWWWVDLNLDKVHLTANYDKDIDKWWKQVKKSLWLNYDINSATKVYIKYKDTTKITNWKKDNSHRIQTWFRYKF